MRYPPPERPEGPRAVREGKMCGMKLRIFTEPQQGASYDTLLRVARAAEELDFDAFYRSDHYLAMGESTGLPGPTDAWITLAGLARETSTIRLGTLMTAATFRLPGPLAIQVAQVDAMSGGRVELGLGAGWFEQEHTAYGIPFPKEKFGRLEEQLEIVTGLWSTPSGEKFDYDGTYYRLADSPALPKPAQRKVPVLIGGMGKVRTPALAARFADEFNIPFASVADSEEQFARVRAAAEERGRDPQDLVLSNALVACVGRDDAEVARRAAAIGRDVAELKENGLAGSPAEVVDKIGRYGQAGASRIYLQILDLDDLDHLELISQQVRGQVA
jgi:F420-dependent oxidoreductase-like protein